MTRDIDKGQFRFVAVAVAVALVAHLNHLPAWLATGCTLVVGFALLNRSARLARLVAFIRLPLAGLLLLAVLVEYGNFFGRDPGTAFACGLLALKLLETRRVRDARAAIGFAAFVLMSALLFRQSLAFSALVGAGTVLLLAALAALQPATQRPPRRLLPSLRQAVLLLLAGIPLAALAFTFMPRPAQPLWGDNRFDSAQHTGLGDTLNPSGILDLLLDDSPAFRVTFDGALPAPADRYFRTLVLWDFNGSEWSRGTNHFPQRAPAIAPRSPPIDYTITLEPTGRRWLPALDVPLDAPHGVWLTTDRTLLAFQDIDRPIAYPLSSVERWARPGTLDTRTRSRALALPDGFDPEARALAERWRSASNGSDAYVVGKALSLFHSEFRYTLQPPPLGRNWIDDFLFGTHAGFCEHYAAAFVFLMRAAGIPARIVTGYQGGTWNPTGSYLLLRQSDAHAWAEVWTNGTGWQRVDPTAAVSPARIDLGASAVDDRLGWLAANVWHPLRNRFDIVDRLWTEAVIHFDAPRQRRLFEHLDDGDHARLWLAFAGVLVLLLALATAWALGGKAAPRRGDALDAAWSRWQRRLAAAGIESRPSEGPVDLSRRLSAAFPESGVELERLVGTYVTLRYATARPPVHEVGRFAAAVRYWRPPASRTGRAAGTPIPASRPATLDRTRRG